MADRTAGSGDVAAEVEVEEGLLPCPTTAPVLQVMLVEGEGEPLPLACMVPEEVLAGLQVAHAIAESGPEKASTCLLTGAEGGPDRLRAGAPQCEAAGPAPPAAEAEAEAVAGTCGAVAALAAAGAALSAAADAVPVVPEVSAGPAARALAAAADAASARAATALRGHATASAPGPSRVPLAAILEAAAPVVVAA